MKKIKFLIFSVLAISFILTACKDDEEETLGVVSFVTPTKTITTDDLSPVSFDLAIDPEAPSASSITLQVSSIGGNAGTAFTTTPSISENKIELAVDAGAKTVSFTLTPIEEGIELEDIRVDFEVLSTGSGLTTEGLTGIFASLYIENNKSLARELPFIENFDNCDEENGSGGFPAGWEEVVVLQNSLGTAQWRCSGGFDGFEINAFSTEGSEGDGSETWLITPKIDLTKASNPTLSFDVDRRFETFDFQEYDVKISADYDGTNFETATWEIIAPAVAAIEANDPEADDYENTGSIDLSAWAGEMINIAFIYYAEGSQLTATILRVDSVVLEEAK